ncbi:MAG: aminotransferase class III-fold pyridoxal phosphate-dependent enzyme [Thermomicrobiales bacterium]|nr:aminotransferase class III-fold pyridoxal phosphate-dependent enzyme [Thermomicrobiales bacterium]
MTIRTEDQSVAPGYDAERIEDAIRDNVWLHFTQMAEFRDPANHPLILVRGEGSTLWDAEGNAYLDLLAGIYSVNAGYGRRRIVEAMTEQALALPFVNPFGYTSVPAAVLADRLGDLAPLGGEARVFFTSGGSESVESALKLAKQYQTLRGYPHRWKTISRRVAYHGTTIGALSVNGLTPARAVFGPMVPGARHAPMSHRYRCPYCADAAACNLMCYDEIERLVEFEGPDQVACIITEPVQNAGGCIPPGSMDYFKKIRKLCDETGILMIMDEVICGFGRLGTLFGSEYFGVEPDIITTAKGITSSYAPLGAVLARKSIADAFESEAPEELPETVRAARTGGFQHGLTFGGHPVACAAAIANLDIMLEENLPGAARDTGAYLRQQLEDALGDHPNVGDIRGAGLFLGIELVTDKATKGTFKDAVLLDDLTDAMRQRGLILRNDGRNDPTTQLCPPLVITREECDRVVAILVETITDLGRSLGTVGAQFAAN